MANQGQFKRKLVSGRYESCLHILAASFRAPDSGRPDCLPAVQQHQGGFCREIRGSVHSQRGGIICRVPREGPGTEARPDTPTPPVHPAVTESAALPSAGQGLPSRGHLFQASRPVHLTSVRKTAVTGSPAPCRRQDTEDARVRAFSRGSSWAACSRGAGAAMMHLTFPRRDIPGGMIRVPATVPGEEAA